MFRKQLLRQSRVFAQHASSPAVTVQRASIHSLLSTSTSRSLRPSSATLPQLRYQRWQSTEADEKDTTPESKAKPAEAEKEDASKAEFEKKNKEIVDLKDKYLRSVADYRNLQDRTKRDMDSARQFAIQKFAADLLDSIDNLDRALISVPKAAIGESETGSGSTTSNTSSADPNVGAASESVGPPNKDLMALYGGLKMTNDIMLGTLKKHGLERFDPMDRDGQKFDPNKDEATFFTKVEGKEDGSVFYTQSKGFTLNGRVIRAARVGVVKNN